MSTSIVSGETRTDSPAFFEILATSLSVLYALNTPSSLCISVKAVSAALSELSSGPSMMVTCTMVPIMARLMVTESFWRSLKRDTARMESTERTMSA